MRFAFSLEGDLAFAILFFFQKHIHFFANPQMPSLVGELIEIDHPFRFISDVHQHKSRPMWTTRPRTISPSWICFRLSS